MLRGTSRPFTHVDAAVLANAKAGDHREAIREGTHGRLPALRAVEKEERSSVSKVAQICREARCFGGQAAKRPARIGNPAQTNFARPARPVKTAPDRQRT